MKRHKDGIPRVPEWSPWVPNCSPDVSHSIKNTSKLTLRVHQCKCRGYNGGPKSSTDTQKKTPRGNPNCSKDSRLDSRVPKNKQAHIYTNNQPPRRNALASKVIVFTAPEYFSPHSIYCLLLPPACCHKFSGSARISKRHGRRQPIYSFDGGPPQGPTTGE